jgi:undecaprenyl pyrophosphate phosphatase UppP
MNWLVAWLMGFVEELTEFRSVSNKPHLLIRDKRSAVTLAACLGTGLVHAT